MSASAMTIDDEGDDGEALPFPTVGDMLVTQFLEPAELNAVDLAAKLLVPPERIAAVIAGERRVDADLDLRLTRYFGMSDGFFLRLQNSHDLRKRQAELGDALDRIVPRVAERLAAE